MDGPTDGLSARFDALADCARDCAGFAAHRAFYHIKNLLLYRLSRMTLAARCAADEIDERRSYLSDRIDGIRDASIKAIAEPLTPGALKLAGEADAADVAFFLNPIFEYIFTGPYEKIYSAFFDASSNLRGEPDEVFKRGYDAFAGIYFTAETTRFAEAFAPRLKKLRMAAAHFKHGLAEEFLKIAPLDLSEFDVKKNGYRLKKAVTENALMADELAACFDVIASFYEDRAEGLASCPDREIITGIYDTVTIKAESIFESKTEYLAAAEQKFGEYAGGLPELNETELNGMVSEAYEAWVSAAERGDRLPDGGGAAERMLASVHFLSYKERLAKYTGAVYNAFEKQDLNYKRLFLLYEVSTYNEIMTYSVTRLLESRDAFSLAFAGACEAARDEIAGVILRNNIAAIDPAPHEPFNGKEHEVLIAEENSAFAKGEIIKALSPGYKKGDAVLARATVIAAK